MTSWPPKAKVLIAAGALGFCFGCTKQAAVPAAEVPSHHAKKEPAREDRGGRRPKPLVAPPPAYGNKVVLLRAHDTRKVL